MKSDATDTRPKMRPLPALTVYRETYCSQEMTDNVVSYLEENAPDLLYSCMVDETPVYDIRFKAYGELVHYLNHEVTKKISIPDKNLGLVDLVYEISRRIRTAYNLPEIKIIGRALTPTIDGPYPILSSFYNVDKDLDKDLVLVTELSYDRDPALWYFLSEAMRRRFLLPSFKIVARLKLQEIAISEGLFQDPEIQAGSATLSAFSRQALTEIEIALRKVCLIPN